MRNLASLSDKHIELYRVFVAQEKVKKCLTKSDCKMNISFRFLLEKHLAVYKQLTGEKLHYQ